MHRMPPSIRVHSAVRDRPVTEGSVERRCVQASTCILHSCEVRLSLGQLSLSVELLSVGAWMTGVLGGGGCDGMGCSLSCWFPGAWGFMSGSAVAACAGWLP